MNNQGKHSVADVAKRHFDINSLLLHNEAHLLKIIRFRRLLNILKMFSV